MKKNNKKKKDFVTGDVVKYVGKRLPDLKNKTGELTATNFYADGSLAGAFFLQREKGKTQRISPVEIKLLPKLNFIKVNFRNVKPDVALNYHKDKKEFNVYDMQNKRNLGNYTEEYLTKKGFTKNQLYNSRKETGYFKRVK